MSSPTPTWGCPIPRGRHELAVTDHTAPPTWVQTGQLGACALSPLHTCPTRLRKVSSHLRVGVHVPGCPQPPIPAGMATSVTELPSTPTLWAVSGGSRPWPSGCCAPPPYPLGWVDSLQSASQAPGAEKVRCHPQVTGAGVGRGAACRAEARGPLPAADPLPKASDQPLSREWSVRCRPASQGQRPAPLP